MTPLVSVLIPVYNREHLVGESIKSAINQTYKNIEIIIVDNFSTDNTWSVLESYQRKDNRIKLFQNSENLGPVLNWKRCFDESKGEYAKILFSDDLMDYNFIEETLPKFNYETAFVLSSIEIFNNKSTIYRSKFQEREKYQVNEYFNNLLGYNFREFPISPGSALFRSKDLKSELVVDILNDFNLDFKKYGAGNDLLLFLKIANKYKFIKTTKNTKAYFRSHDDSFTISNDLALLYDYSKYYFIHKYQPNFLSVFRTDIWLEHKLYNKKSKILDIIGVNINLSHLIKGILKRIITKQSNTLIKIKNIT